MGRHKDRRTMLFFALTEMNYVIFKPMHERLREDPRLSITFTGKHHGRCNVEGLYAKAGAGDVKTRHTWISRHLRHDLYIAADAKPRGRAKHKIMLFHGVSMKHFFFAHIEHYDRLFMYGDYMRRSLIKGGVPADDEMRFPMIGYPKLDCLVDGTLDAAGIKASIGLDPAKPTVIYAPTHAHGGKCSIYSAGKAIIETLTGMDVNVIVKLHSLLHDPRLSKADWVDALKADPSPNLYLATGHDSSPCLYVSDVLVTDISSIGWEFALLDRPTIYYDVPELTEALTQRGCPPDLNAWGRKAGTVVKDCRELRAAVEMALANSAEKSDIRRAMVSDIYYRPGTATDRAVARLYEYLKLDLPQSASGQVS